MCVLPLLAVLNPISTIFIARAGEEMVEGDSGVSGIRAPQGTAPPPERPTEYEALSTDYRTLRLAARLTSLPEGRSTGGWGVMRGLI
jgi:hypothetical protein